MGYIFIVLYFVIRLLERNVFDGMVVSAVQKLTVITGRGSHSLNGPKIKKAVSSFEALHELSLSGVTG